MFRIAAARPHSTRKIPDYADSFIAALHAGDDIEPLIAKVAAENRKL